MLTDYLSLDMNTLAHRWWAMVARGCAAIIFGFLSLAAPKIGLLTLVISWGLYALADGIFNLTMAIQGARAGRSWGWLLFEGVVSLAAGLCTFVWPQITAMGLLGVIAFWALMTGVAELEVAVRIREYVTGEWRLALSGILSILFGLMLLLRPAAGALAMGWLIGAYAIFFGGLLVALGLKLNSWRRRIEREIPTGATPTHA